MLLLETQPHQKIPTHHSAIRSVEGVTLPDSDHCSYAEGKTQTAIPAVTPEHFGVCSSSCGSHRLLQLLLAESWVLARVRLEFRLDIRKKEEFRLDIRKKFFTVRVVKHWHRLPER